MMLLGLGVAQILRMRPPMLDEQKQLYSITVENFGHVQVGF